MSEESDLLEPLSPRARNTLEEAVQAIKNGEAEVDLSYTAIGPPGAKFLCAEVKKSETLRKLDVAHCQLGVEGAWEIADALRSNASLTYLDLSENDIEGQGLERICGALSANGTLETLHLCNNVFYAEDGAALGAMLRGNTTLETLGLGACDLQDGTAAIAAALAENVTLASLDLEGNAMSEDDAGSLAEALRTNGSLRHLSLVDNADLGGAAVARICGALRDNPASRIESIDLASTGLGPEDFPAVLDWIKGSAIVEKVNVSCNRLGDSALAALALAAQSHPSLTAVAAKSTGCGAAGAMMFIAALSANERLRSISLFGNDIPQSSLDALRGAAQRANLPWNEKMRQVGSP